MGDEQANKSVMSTHSRAPVRLGSEVESISDLVERSEMHTDLGNCEVKNIDDAEVLMDPHSVTIKCEPDFESTLEEAIVNVNFEASEIGESMESIGSSMKRDVDDGEELMKPLFVLIKVEPNFERTSEKNVMEEDFETAKDTELPKEVHWGTHIRCRATSCGLELASSTQSPSVEQIKMDDQNHSSQNVCSSLCGLLQLQNFDCQEPVVPAVDSTALSSKCEEETADRYMPEGHAEETVERVRQIQHFARSESESFLECSRDKITFAQEPPAILTQTSEHTEKWFKCSQCEKSFKRKNDLNGHMRVHTGDTPFRCSQCGKSFRHTGTLSKHIQIHTGEKPFKCCECGKVFKRSDALSSHMVIHTGERPYKCSQCGKQFKRAGELSSHMKTHTSEAPFKCNQCGKAFKRSTHLSAHMRIHTGEKPYKCSQCGKCFATTHSFTIHIRAHTGERPFTCSVCKKSFKTSSNLRRHRHAAAAAASMS